MKGLCLGMHRSRSKILSLLEWGQQEERNRESDRERGRKSIQVWSPRTPVYTAAPPQPPSSEGSGFCSPCLSSPSHPYFCLSEGSLTFMILLPHPLKCWNCQAVYFTIKGNSSACLAGLQGAYSALLTLNIFVCHCIKDEWVSLSIRFLGVLT